VFVGNKAGPGDLKLELLEDGKRGLKKISPMTRK
jgi:hypothetical protein